MILLENKFIFLIIFSIAVTVNGQEIVGLWQESTCEIGAALGNNYQFYPDGKVTFRISEFQDFGKRIIGFNGRYRVEKDSIKIKILSTIERVGGKLEFGDPLTNNPGWVLADYETKEISSKNNQYISIGIKFETKNGCSVLILDDSFEYYKLKDN